MVQKRKSSRKRSATKSAEADAEDADDTAKVAEMDAKAAKIRALNAAYMKDLREGKMVQKSNSSGKRSAAESAEADAECRGRRGCLKGCRKESGSGEN
jgi:hypothetical protein